MALRVDSIPWYLRPILGTYAHLLARLEYFHYWVNHRTIRISWLGRENLEPEKNYIFAFWHRYFPCYFSAFIHNENHVWMGHPPIYMYHIWLLVRLMGVRKIIPGSTGHDGRKAADQLVEALKAGASTVIAPDGPGGPPQVLKRGILHIAAQSGVPVVPIFFAPKPGFRIWSWDKKVFPVPFGGLEVRIGKPIEVLADEMENSAAKIIAGLSGYPVP